MCELHRKIIEKKNFANCADNFVNKDQFDSSLYIFMYVVYVN